MSLLLPISDHSWQATTVRSHLLVYEVQTCVDCHYRLSLILLQQHRTDLLVDVRIVIEYVEFLRKDHSVCIRLVECFAANLLDCAILLLLRLQPLS
jgi:hypothetical protein